MNRLFIKIFLWFWLAMALVWSAFSLPMQLTQDEDVVDRFRTLHGQRLILAGRVAVNLGRRSPEAITQFMSDLEEEGAPYPFVFDAELNEITGRDVPDAARASAAATFEAGLVHGGFSGTGPYAGRTFVNRLDDAYAVVQRLPSRFDLPPPSVLPVVARWLAVLLISGLVCYAMARYTLAPVGTLSEATRRFAEGQLDTRVSGDLGGRGDELAGLGRDFDDMAERIGTLLDNQRQLLTDISHELRSPLARLYVALGLVRRQSDAAATDALDRIERETERLNELIGQLLTLTRLQDSETTGDRLPVDLVALVREVVEDADYEAREDGKSVQLDTVEACTTTGRQELLRRAIENVVRNAVRYAPTGSTVEASLAVVQSNGSAQARIEVRDHGPGVPDSELGRLFQPFYRVDSARDRERGGTGLGLSISKRAVRAHGGSISASNPADGGLLVEIQLPAAIGSA